MYLHENKELFKDVVSRTADNCKKNAGGGGKRIIM